MLRAQVVIRNNTDEPLTFSKNITSQHSIGWQVQSETSGQLAKLRGTINVEQIIPAGSLKIVFVDFHVDFESVQADKALGIEFCIVDGGNWLNKKFPLNSTWLVLMLPSELRGAPSP